MEFKQVLRVLTLLSIYTFANSHILTIEYLAANNGYSLEVHNVTTDDGYILQMHRIPHKSGKVVFLMHDIFCSSADFLVTGRKQALAFLLADNGYDVWLGNARGNNYSRNHIHLHPDSSEFWDFTWHEIGIYDLPAMIDRVVDVTHKDIYYIGHSQGATAFFVMASMLPKYNGKIIRMTALAPLVYMSNIPSNYAKNEANIILKNQTYMSIINNTEFIPIEDFMLAMDQAYCKYWVYPELTAICDNAYILVSGYKSKQFNYSQIDDILTFNPSTTAVNSIAHYGQEILSGQFAQYGYGKKYDLSKVTTKISIYYSSYDLVVSQTDMLYLHGNLSHANLYVVPDSSYTHSDFLYAMTAPTIVYQDVINEIKDYSDFK